MILRQGAPGLHEIRESPAGAEGLSPWRDGAAAGLARAAGCRCAPSRAVVNENCLVDDSRDLPRSGRGAKALALRALTAMRRRGSMLASHTDALVPTSLGTPERGRTGGWWPPGGGAPAVRPKRPKLPFPPSSPDRKHEKPPCASGDAHGG